MYNPSTESIYYIYRHIRLDKNEVFYIGLAKRTKDDFKFDRYKRSYSKHSRCKFWKDLTKNTKYEVEIILENLTLEEAKSKEKEFIKLYGRRELGTGTLVNATDGGEGVIGKKYTLEENKAKSIRVMGNNNPFYGRHHSEETKDKLRELRKERFRNGWKHPMLGRKQSKESIERTRLKQSKPILQFDKNGNFIKEYKSGAETKNFGFSPVCVSACCNNKLETHKKFIWKFKSIH